MKHSFCKKLNFGILFLTSISLVYAYFAEYYLGMEPCPLCIAQRVIVGLIFLISLIFAIHNPKGLAIRLYSLIILGLALFGIKISSHHIWLMNLPPDQQPLSCGMPLSMLYKRVPLNSFLHTILQGDAECGKITWKIFGLTPPMAVLILCSIIAISSIIIFFSKKA